MRDIKSNLKFVEALPLALRTTSNNGNNVDMQGYESVAVLFYSESAITDGTHTPELESAPDDGAGSPGDWEDVASSDIIGGPLAAFDSNNEGVQSVGFRNSKGHRFLRTPSIVTGGPGTGGRIGSTVILGHPGQMPVV